MITIATFEQQRADLDWAVQTLAAQPADVQQLYRQTGQALAHALLNAVYTFSVEYPIILVQDGAPVTAPRPTRLYAGNFLNTLQRYPCRTELLARAAELTVHRDGITAKIARLVAYATGEYIVLHHIPNLDQIKSAAYQSFTPQGQLTTHPEDVALPVTHLSAFIDALNLVERLFPAWAADDGYNEKAAALTAQLTTQGRALANYYTQQMIAELQARWQRREVIRGLTLRIPYLDEKIYHMLNYEVVVIPTGRIPFRPEFILGACRVEQQKVRKNPRFSQATRWQLISQLDELIQAFET